MDSCVLQRSASLTATTPPARKVQTVPQKTRAGLPENTNFRASLPDSTSRRGTARTVGTVALRPLSSLERDHRRIAQPTPSLKLVPQEMKAPMVAYRATAPLTRTIDASEELTAVDSVGSSLQSLSFEPEPLPFTQEAPRQSLRDDVIDLQQQEVDDLWLQIREEARRDAEAEPALASYLYSTVLAHRSLESALAAHLANKLASPTLLSSHLLILFRDVLLSKPAVCSAMRRDIYAARDRDPACLGYLHCLLNFKGFSALQVHRVAHELWKSGRHFLALALQSRTSEVFHVDIHPAAKFGSGILFDHATGIVVGETAEIGDDVSMLHNVTLGGTGVAVGRRHPKIGNGAVLGTGARILGPITLSDGAKVGAGSLVLEDVAEGVTVVGNPAKEVKRKRVVGATFVLDYNI